MIQKFIIDGIEYEDTFKACFLYAMRLMADNIIFDDNFNQDIEYVPADVVMEYLEEAEHGNQET